MTTWDAVAPGARPRRIRGGEIPVPDPVTWREQQRRARAQRRSAAVAQPDSDQPAVGFRLGGLWVDADALFAFGYFLPMVFMVQFATAGAAAIAGLTPLYLFVRREQLWTALAPRLFLLTFPAFALFSVVWSESPKETLRYALELFITIVAALLISSARNQRAVLRAIALAFMIYVADALIVGGRVTIGVGAGGDAFSGLTDSKNLMADIASTGLIASLAVVIISARDRKWIWVGLLAAASIMEAYCVVAARSAGALLGLALGLAPLAVLSPLVAAGRVLRAWLTTTVALVLLVVGLNYRTLSQAMIDLGASLFNKDPTLTGRTYLWYRASDLIHEKPILGRGYFSFWLQGNIDAEGLWRYGGIVDRGGFNFHNTLVDLLVTVGWVGAVVLICVVATGLAALVRRFVNRPSLPLVFWISILLYELSRTPFETLGIQPFAFTTTLVFAALGAAFSRAPAPEVTRRQAIRAAVPVEATVLGDARRAWSTPRFIPARGSLRLLRSDPPAP